MSSRLDQVLGGHRSLARISAIGASVSPTLAPGETGITVPAKSNPSLGEFFSRINAERQKDVPDGIGTIAGAVAGGYLLRKEHPLLGIIGGASLGRNAPALLNPGMRSEALRNLVTTGGGLAGSLYAKKHPLIGFLLGALAGGTAAYYAKLGRE